MTLNSSTLISLIVVGSNGFDSTEADISNAIRSIRRDYAFFEILLISIAGDPGVGLLLQKLGRVGPQIRLLYVEGPADFDRMAVHGYQESIGDAIIVTTPDELGSVAMDSIIGNLVEGNELVRVRRAALASPLERVGSVLVKTLTGLEIDIRMLRTLGISRRLLSELLARPEEIHLFRFTAHSFFSSQTVLEADLVQPRKGAAFLIRRIDLLARLVAVSAPRLLRMASAICLAASLLALVSLLYVLGSRLFLPQVAAGWTTTTSLLAVWMFVQLGATSVICMGIARAVDGQDRARTPRLVEEMTISDLFSDFRQLNVEIASQKPR